MATTNNPIDSSLSLPTLAALQRRRRQLIAFQYWRIGEALNASPQGLTRFQIRELFHGHINSERIDLAVEQLRTLGLIDRHTAPGRGRPSTLWTAVEDAKDSNPEPKAGT